MDEPNDVYNGKLTTNEPIINEEDVLDYEAIIEKLEADVEEARQATITVATGYIELAATLGFNADDVLAGKITHAIIIDRLKVIIGEH